MDRWKGAHRREGGTRIGYIRCAYERESVGKIALSREINLPTLSIELYRINEIKTKQRIIKAPHFNDWTDIRSQLSSTCCFWVILFSNADAKKEPQRIATCTSPRMYLPPSLLSSRAAPSVRIKKIRLSFAIAPHRHPNLRRLPWTDASPRRSM